MSKVKRQFLRTDRQEQDVESQEPSTDYREQRTQLYTDSEAQWPKVYKSERREQCKGRNQEIEVETSVHRAETQPHQNRIKEPAALYTCILYPVYKLLTWHKRAV